MNLNFAATYVSSPEVLPIPTNNEEVLGGSVLPCAETVLPMQDFVGKAINQVTVTQDNPSLVGATLRTSGDGGDGGQDLYEAIRDEIEIYDAPPVPKCSRRGCKQLNSQVFMCAGIDCVRVIHETCYMVVTQSNKDMDLLPAGIVVCTKKCYTKYLKGIERSAMCSKGVIDMMWDRDGRRGESDPNTSMSVLLEWWMSEGNYAKYRGTNNHGVTKKMWHSGLLLLAARYLCAFARKKVCLQRLRTLKNLGKSPTIGR